MTETLAELVRRRRAELKLNQTQLGEMLGLSGKAGQTAVSDIERGVTKWPDADRRRRLAVALGVTHLEIIVATGELRNDEIPAEGEPRPLVGKTDPRGKIIAAALELPETDTRGLYPALASMIKSVAAEGNEKTKRSEPSSSSK